MKKEVKERIYFIGVIILILAFAFGMMYLGETYGEPDTPIDFYKFQDNQRFSKHIKTHNNYVYSLGHPTKLLNTNETTQFLVELDEDGYSNLSVKYSTETEPNWTELADSFTDMGNKQYLLDCIKTYPGKTITYCVSATNSAGKYEEYYFSYIIP